MLRTSETEHWMITRHRREESIPVPRFVNTAGLLLFAGGILGAQTNSPVPTIPAQAPGTSPVALATAPDKGLPQLSTPENEVVITIDACDPPAADACQTRLTREQFEQRFRTIYAGPTPPNMHPPDATVMANQYVRLFAYAYEARKEGLDHDPKFQQQLQYVEMELLANALQKKLKDETAHPSEQALESYYNKIIRQFDEITVRSVLIPRPPRSQAAAAAGNAEGAAPWPEGEDAETQRIADRARQELVAGEAPDQVEKEVYAAVNSKQPPPSTQPLEWRRNVHLPAPEEAMLFALKPGEVSLPVPNGYGFTIYRLESKRTLPLAMVKTEVKALYQMEQIEKRLNSYLENTHPVLNKEFFATEKQAELQARQLEEMQEENAHRQQSETQPH